MPGWGREGVRSELVLAWSSDWPRVGAQRFPKPGGAQLREVFTRVAYAPLSSSTGMVRIPAVWRSYSAKPG